MAALGSPAAQLGRLVLGAPQQTGVIPQGVKVEHVVTDRPAIMHTVSIQDI